MKRRKDIILENDEPLMAVDASGVAVAVDLKNLNNASICGCCGQVRSYPTEPNELWEYTDTFRFTWYNEENWRRVRTELPPEGEEGLMIIPLVPDLDCEEEPDEPIWWPRDVIWRKVS